MPSHLNPFRIHHLGKQYFFNSITRETSWSLPVGAELQMHTENDDNKEKVVSLLLKVCGVVNPLEVLTPEEIKVRQPCPSSLSVLHTDLHLITKTVDWGVVYVWVLHGYV
jgi:hypothetical protein